MRQQGKPLVAPKPSPIVPPKPARVERIAHLPPSGSIQSRSPSANGRKPIVNQAFLNDLHQAMNQKRNQNHQKFPNDDEDSYGQVPAAAIGDRPFPNRFSSGEYENVQQQPPASNQVKKPAPPPPLPKRNGETHVTWDRT